MFGEMSVGNGVIPKRWSEPFWLSVQFVHWKIVALSLLMSNKVTKPHNAIPANQQQLVFVLVQRESGRGGEMGDQRDGKSGRVML